SSSASAGVIPNPAAAFSQLAMTRSTACCWRSSGRRSFTIVRPGRPKMSPIKRIFKRLGLRCQVLGPRAALLTIKRTPNFRWYHAENRAAFARQPDPPRASSTGYWQLATDLSRLQEVVIPRRIQSHVPHTPRVHEYVIEVPQVHIRDILRQHFLNFSV